LLIGQISHRDSEEQMAVSVNRGTNASQTLHILPAAAWEKLHSEMRSVAPEAFTSDGAVLNLIGGEWRNPGHEKPYFSPNDGTHLGAYPMIDVATARHAVELAAREFPAWANTDLDERKRRVAECVEGLKRHRDLLTYLLMWEIGKPFRLAQVDVDRCISGVEWYLEKIEDLMGSRKPLGLISNIASWNYPMSVIVHTILVQLLTGNSIIAKTPSDGGIYALTISMALARRAGLPVSLVSGSGGNLSEALVRHPDVACLSFVGGKTSGGTIAAYLHDESRRYMLEMEGVNAYGIWEFSDWPTLAKQLKKGFEYGKQRCTAYVRFVIQRKLFSRFLDAYLPVLKSIRFGHPVLVGASEELPDYDFGPLINAKKVEELRVHIGEALAKNAVSLFEGSLDESLFLPEQDISSYFGPVSLMNLASNCHLYHNEPFGPVDTIVLVDRVEELVNEMNVSNGALVSSVACDDPKLARQIASQVRAFKVGINVMRSRGDREECFGGIGQSWKGCFVGGKYLVQATTVGEPGERLYGNFPDYVLLPPER
jgi:acyl-CoA reductase-like NAD-dependent aldehyde dehydrogenase